MSKHNVLRWWITFTLICLATVVFFITGMVDRINEADVTKISFAIGLIFMYYTYRVGLWNYKLSKVVEGLHARVVIAGAKSFINRGWFAANILLDLGMIGTVIGFIYMLGTSFGNLAVANTANLKLALQSMGTGMATALYTTAAGLICSVLLKLQMHPLAQLIEEMEER